MKQLIWDLPTRIAHWVLALAIFLAYAFAQLAPERSAVFYGHMLLGLLAGLLLAWRVVWGLMGSKHARFASLLFRPGELWGYFLSVARGKGTYYAGHNPGSALAIWAIFVLTIVTVGSGLGLGFSGEAFEEIHEIAPNLLLAIVAMHVAGVLVATLMHKENYLFSMFSGRKTGQPNDAIAHSHPLAALILVLGLAAASCYLVGGFDFSSGSFRAPGTSISLHFGEEG